MHQPGSKRRKDVYPESQAEIFGPPEIDASEITRDRVLGDGSFGAVYKGRCRQKDVAVKVLFRQFDEKSLTAFRKEVAIMSKIFHPNIVLFLGACTSIPGQLMICTELMEGNLEQLLLNHQYKFPLLARIKMARDTALGILWLHSSNPVFIHRDLKTSNLLVDSNMTVKVCDFGLSQIKQRGTLLQDGKEGAKGTPLWMAPEVLQGQQFNEKADVYSFGLVLWQMIARQELFPQFHELQTFITAICRDGLRPTIPADCPPPLKDIITACWQASPEARPDFSKIVTALESIIVDCAIPDELGSAFWKKTFFRLEHVPWKDFLNAFAMALGLTNSGTPSMSDMLQFAPEQVTPELELNIRCLKAVLVSTAKIQGQEEEVVTMEQFGKLIAWFGSLKTDGKTLLDKVRYLLSFSWFHGDISPQESESRLTNKAEGTFLVRFSTTEMGVFTISKMSAHGIVHQRIHRPQGLYQANKKAFSSVPELIAQDNAALNISSPCQGTKYAALFRKQQLSGYLNL